MKLPKFEQVAPVNSYGNGQFYSTAMTTNPALPGIEMNGIFDDIWGGIKDVAGTVLGKIPCVLSKAGAKGVSCLTQCGPNPVCLATCAGPTLMTSIMECI